jgi:hypothetical protein
MALTAKTIEPAPICWGAKVSPAFRDSVRRIGARLAINPDYLMACMAFESARTFDPAIRNAAGSGAIGLIQFMPSTAAALGTTTEALGAMSACQQMVFVEAYFRPWKNRLRTLADVYMAILWPGAIGKPEGWVLFDEADKAHPKRYLQNRGLDFNRDGKITKAEAASGPELQLDAGLRRGNAA